MFRVEKGNWSTDGITWCDYGIFRDGEEKAIVICFDEEVASFLCNQFNENCEGEEWKNQ